MIFNVQKCNEELELPDYPDAVCAEDSLLDNFIKDFTVEVWTMTEKIFFDKRFEKPIYHTL
jgi:hypothetical protein